MPFYYSYKNSKRSRTLIVNYTSVKQKAQDFQNSVVQSAQLILSRTFALRNVIYSIVNLTISSKNTASVSLENQQKRKVSVTPVGTAGREKKISQNPITKHINQSLVRSYKTSSNTTKLQTNDCYSGDRCSLRFLYEVIFNNWRWFPKTVGFGASPEARTEKNPAARSLPGCCRWVRVIPSPKAH